MINLYNAIKSHLDRGNTIIIAEYETGWTMYEVKTMSELMETITDIYHEDKQEAVMHDLFDNDEDYKPSFYDLFFKTGSEPWDRDNTLEECIMDHCYAHLGYTSEDLMFLVHTLRYADIYQEIETALDNGRQYTMHGITDDGKIVNYGFFIDNNDHTLKYCHDTKYIDTDGHTVVTDEVLTCRITRAKILKLLGTLSIEWFKGWKYCDDIQEAL